MTEDMTPRPGPAHLTARLTGLGSAHVTGNRYDGGDIAVRVGAAHCTVAFDGLPAEVRQIATDMLALVDALEGSE
jgi:hypothetical protein